MVRKNYSDMPVNQNVKGIHMEVGVPNTSNFFGGVGKGLL